MDLYFGCRRAKHDNLYSDERTQAEANGALTAAYTAISRDADVPKVHTRIKLKKLCIDSFDYITYNHEYKPIISTC